MVTSRLSPSSHHSKLLASSNLAETNNFELRLNIDETQAIAALRGSSLDSQQISTLHQMSLLCAEALKNGIETDYVTDIIRI